MLTGSLNSFSKMLLRGDVVAHEIAQAVALLGVHAAGQADAYAEHLDPRNPALGDLVLDHAADRPERKLVGFKHEFDVLDEVDYVSLEVADRHVEVVPCYVHPHEVSGFGVESEHAGPAPSGGADLAFVLDEVVVDELGDELGDRGHAYAQCAAEVGTAVVRVRDAEPQDFSFDGGVLVRSLAKEGREHKIHIICKYISNNLLKEA